MDTGKAIHPFCQKWRTYPHTGIAYIMVAFSFTAIDLDRRISLIMVLLITFVIILFLNMILFSSSLMLPYRYEIFAGEALLLILLLHRKLEHAFVRRKSI